MSSRPKEGMKIVWMGVRAKGRQPSLPLISPSVLQILLILEYVRSDMNGNLGRGQVTKLKVGSPGSVLQSLIRVGTWDWRECHD